MSSPVRSDTTESVAVKISDVAPPNIGTESPRTQKNDWPTGSPILNKKPTPLSCNDEQRWLMNTRSFLEEACRLRGLST